MFKKILLPLPPSQVSSLSGRSRLRLQPQPLSSPLRLLLLSASLLRREPPGDHPRLGRLSCEYVFRTVYRDYQVCN